MSFSDFLSRCAEAKHEIEKFKRPFVVGHYDCDGITSTSIVVTALRNMGKEPVVKTIKKLGEREMEEIRKHEEIILTDIGIEGAEIGEGLDGKSVVVVDHHQCRECGLLQVNPRMFGFDGDYEISSSGAAYFLFHEFNLTELAIVGAVGDMQSPFIGLNREILRSGIDNGTLRCDIDLNLFGRVSRPLVWLLSYSTEPFLPGLSGNESNCAQLLKSIGVEAKKDGRWRRYSDLEFDERRALISGLVAYLLSMDVDREQVKEVIGEVYTLTRHKSGSELSDANEYSTLLNACGRHDRAEVGIGVCLGDEGALQEARTLLGEHRRQLRGGMTYGRENCEDFGKFYFLDARGAVNEGIVGIVAGVLYGTVKRDKPIIAIALDEEGNIKVSARATKGLVEGGVNLGGMLETASSGIGSGGGHKIAAGATVKSGKLNEFLRNISKGL